MIRISITFLTFLTFYSFSLTSLALYDDGARFAFTASAEQKSIQIIDLHKRQRVDQIKLDIAPDSIAASERLKALIISHQLSKQLTLIDLSSENLTQIIYPLSISPDYVSVSPLGETVVIYDQSEDILEVHALQRKAVLLRAENISTSQDFTFNIDGSKIYWTDQEDGSLNSIDLWSEQQTIKLSANGENLSALTRSTDGRLGFVSEAGRNVVIVIDLATLKILSEVFVGAGPQRPWGTADGQFMLVPNARENSLTALSTYSLQVLYTIPSLPEVQSVNPGWLDSNSAIVSENGEILFIKTSTGQVLNQHNIGRQTRPGVVTADSKTLTIATTGALSFFDMQKSAALNTIEDLPSDIGTTALAISNNLCH